MRLPCLTMPPLTATMADSVAIGDRLLELERGEEASMTDVFSLIDKAGPRSLITKAESHIRVGGYDKRRKIS